MLRGRLSIQRQSGKALRAEGAVGAFWRGERNETSFEPAAHIRLGIGSSSQVLSSRLVQRLCRNVIRRAGRRQNVRLVRGLVWCFEMRASCAEQACVCANGRSSPCNSPDLADVTAVRGWGSGMEMAQLACGTPWRVREAGKR